MRPILSVMSTTFRESIRNRTVLTILLLAVAFTLSALVLADMALDQRVRVILDWGMFCVSFFGVVLAILIGINLVHKEVRLKSLYVVLSRPLHRWQYVLGKYLGLVATLLTGFVALLLSFLVLLLIEGFAPDHLLFKALFASLLEILVVAALAIFFASFASPFLSGFFTLGLFVIGRTLPLLEKIIDRVEIPAPHFVLKCLFFVLPDFAAFNLDTQVVHAIDIPNQEVLWLSAYGFGYLTLLLFFSIWIFSRRDLV